MTKENFKEYWDLVALSMKYRADKLGQIRNLKQAYTVKQLEAFNPFIIMGIDTIEELIVKYTSMANKYNIEDEERIHLKDIEDAYNGAKYISPYKAFC